MSLSFKRAAIFVFAAASLALAGAAPASATTFCVPGFHAGCPDNDSNVNEPSLESAMDSLGNDGEPDKIIISAEFPTQTGSIFPEPGAFSTDPLEVVGAGTGLTGISATGFNILVMNLASTNFAQRKVTFRDLSFVSKSGQSQGLVQSEGDVFDGVNIISDDATGIGGGTEGVRVINGGTFNDVEFFGSNGGSFSRPITTGFANPGEKLEITGTSIENSGTAVVADDGTEMPVTIKSSRIAVDGQVLDVNDGEQSLIENSVIEAGKFIPLYVTSLGSGSPSLTLRNNTIENVAGASTAIRVFAGPAATGSASAIVTDSIIRGFPNAWELTAPVSGSLGDANLDVSYSNLSASGTKTGDGTLAATQGVINQDPLYAGPGDYHLSPSSSSIDAGNPEAGGLLTDIEGSVRPLDGNGDGTAVRDQGAYEAPTLPTCSNDPSLCPHPPGAIAPKITALKAKKIKKKAKTIRFAFKSSKAATVRFTFKPTGKKKPKRKTVKVSKKAKAGANTFKLKKSKVKPGKYAITIAATDSEGRKSTAKVKAIYVKSGKKFNVQKN